MGGPIQSQLAFRGCTWQTFSSALGKGRAKVLGTADPSPALPRLSLPSLDQMGEVGGPRQGSPDPVRNIQRTSSTHVHQSLGREHWFEGALLLLWQPVCTSFFSSCSNPLSRVGKLWPRRGGPWTSSQCGVWDPFPVMDQRRKAIGGHSTSTPFRQLKTNRKEVMATNMAPAPGLLLAAQKPVTTLDQEMVLFSHRWLQKTASHFGLWGGLAGEGRVMGCGSLSLGKLWV